MVARPPGLPEYKDTIQHGATINYGNSGGPLLDHHGRLVGINTLTNAGSADAPVQGQYYSIAIDSAKREIVDKLLKGESPNDMGWAVEEYYPGYFKSLDRVKGPALDEQLANGGSAGRTVRQGGHPGLGGQQGRDRVRHAGDEAPEHVDVQHRRDVRHFRVHPPRRRCRG